MKKIRHTATQIVTKLREAEALLSTGKTVEEVSRHLGSPRRRTTGGGRSTTGVQVDQVTRMKELEEENRRLKQVVAEQALDLSVLREVARGNY